MWIAQVEIDGEEAVIGRRAKKFSVRVSGYPVSFYEEKNGIYVYMIGFVFGEENNIKKFINELKNDKRVLHLEHKGNFLIGQIKEPLQFKPIYHHRILHIEPIIIKENGMELWTVGSWNKKELIDFVTLVQKTHKGKLLKIRQEKITHFSIVRVSPQLTSQQQKAMDLAIMHGYYKYPRGIGLEELAKLMKLSYSTFQAHLRKAEQKLLPFLFERSR
jgi:predicted DNA binding protein